MKIKVLCNVGSRSHFPKLSEGAIETVDPETGKAMIEAGLAEDVSSPVPAAKHEAKKAEPKE